MIRIDDKCTSPILSFQFVNMYLSFALYLVAGARPLSGVIQASVNSRHIDILVSASVPRLQISTAIESDWGAAALTFNFTRRDAGSLTAPLPISGATSAPVESNFTLHQIPAVAGNQF